MMKAIKSLLCFFSLLNLSVGRFNSPHAASQRKLMFDMDAAEYEALATNTSLATQLSDDRDARHYGHVVLRNVAMSIGDAHQVSLLSRAGLIKCLDLNRCFVVGDGLASILAAALTNTSNVEWISAHHCNLNEVVLSRMKMYMPYYEERAAYGEDPIEPAVIATSSKATETIVDDSNAGKKLSSNSKKRGKGAQSKLASNSHLKVLDLSFSNLDSKAHRTIATILSQSIGLEVLVLDGNRMHGNDVRSIIHSSRRHPSLKCLSLSGCKLSDECIEFIAFGLKSNANITHLDLSGNDITPLGLQMLVNAMDQGACRHLQMLDLSYNDLGDDGLLALARCLAKGKLPSLQRLVLREIDVGQKALLELMSALASSSSPVTLASLHTLDISGNALEGSSVSKASKDSSYAGKIGKKLGIDTSKFTKKGTQDYLSSTAAAATPVINDGLAKLSSGISSIGSILETGADAGLKLLTGDDDYSDAGVIRVDKGGSGDYGYGISYGKSKASERFNHRKGKSKGKSKGKRKGTKRASSRVLSAAKKKAKEREAEGGNEESVIGGDIEEDGGKATTEIDPEPVTTPPQSSNSKVTKSKKGAATKRRKQKRKKELKSVNGIVALVQAVPSLRRLGLARCGLREKWSAQMARQCAEALQKNASEVIEGTTESVQTETLGRETGLSLLLRLNGLSVQQQTDAEAALQRIASASKAATER